MKKFIFIFAIALLFFGCAFEGKVYVAIHIVGNNPDLLTHNIKGLPPFGTFVTGAYYQTFPESYTISPVYGITTYQLDFTLTTNKTVLGIEDKYYDIICIQDADPIIRNIPTY